MRQILLTCCIFLLSYGACNSQLTTHQFPRPVDTSDKEISLQKKETRRINKYLTIDNAFNGARFSDLIIHNDTAISISTKPENEPINSSPWYALRLISERESTSTLTIQINYPVNHKHRYWPNISIDGESWSRIDSTIVRISDDSLKTTVTLEISSDTTWVSAQPIIASQHVNAWCKQMMLNEHVDYSTAGTSLLGRELPFLKIGSGAKAIVIFSRQHPPEVTGFLALQFFLDEIVSNNLSNDFLREYSLLVYPLLNPDGVDLGHWRHNAAGVDLNRDWAYYRQPEVNAVANHVVKTLNEENLEVVLGLDFHSTWYDVYYSTDRSLEVKNLAFTDKWFQHLEANIEGYKVKDAPSGLRSPVSKGWFVSQFNAPGITYEIGDNTSLEFNKKKSKVAASGLMKIFLEE